MNEEINEIIISQTKSQKLTESLMEQIMDIAESLKRISLMIKDIYIKFESLKRLYHKSLKMVQEKKAKEKSLSTKGMYGKKPMNVELQTLFKIKDAISVSKLDLQRLFNEYILLNDLRDKTDRIKINPNQELKTIFKLDTNDSLTYLNLAKYVEKVK